MKTTMKKLAATLLALILVLQVLPVLADEQITSNVQGPIDKYRETLEVSSPRTILMVDDKVQLTWTADYNVEWSTSNEEIATVDATGLVTAKAPGMVRITAKSGAYRDSIILHVKEPENNKSGTETIVISGNKEKIPYDGKEHEVTYTATSQMEGFDASKVVLKNADKKVVGTDCGVYQTKFDAEDFKYEGNDDVTFIVSDGWIQIKPVTVTVKANSAQLLQDKANNPELSATVENLPEGMGESVIHYDLRISDIGGTDVVEPYGESVQGNFKVKYISAPVTVVPKLPLYNIAKIDNTWYRLAKSEIWTTKELKDPNFGKTIPEGEYFAEKYDFTDLVITVNGKNYVYKCNENADAIIDGANYYTAELFNIEIIKNKIGAMNGNNPRWLVPENQRYNDPNNTDSIHRNYTIKLTQNKLKTEEQPIINMVNVTGEGITPNMNYYRMKMTTIKAVPASTLTTGAELKKGEYSLAPYDFTNVVIAINGETYRYSDHELTGEYESYYTVEFEKVVFENKVNKKDDWYNDEKGWLDGAKEQYGAEGNNYPNFHANYKAVIHKGTRPPRKVTIKSDWPEDKVAYPGAKITLTATVTGFSDNVQLQWQRSVDRTNWEDIPGANDITYTFILDDSTAQYSWRVVANE